jgi:hypothetical protein
LVLEDVEFIDFFWDGFNIDFDNPEIIFDLFFCKIIENGVVLYKDLIGLYFGIEVLLVDSCK